VRSIKRLTASELRKPVHRSYESAAGRVEPTATIRVDVNRRCRRRRVAPARIVRKLSDFKRSLGTTQSRRCILSTMQWMSRHRRRARDLTAVFVSLAVTGYAMVQRLQIVAIVGLVVAVGTLYRGVAVRFLDIAARFASNVSRAKYRDFEIEAVAKELVRLDGLHREKLSAWEEIALELLTPEMAAVLIHVHMEGRTVIAPNMIGRLRFLRNRGLITHDEPELRNSRHVWTTRLGARTATLLTEHHPRDSPAVGPEPPTPRVDD